MLTLLLASLSTNLLKKMREDVSLRMVQQKTSLKESKEGGIIFKAIQKNITALKKILKAIKTELSNRGQ